MYYVYLIGINLFLWLMSNAVTVTVTGKSIENYTLLWWVLLVVSGIFTMYAANKLTTKKSD